MVRIAPGHVRLASSSVTSDHVLSPQGASNMTLTWIAGYVLAAGLLWGGLSKQTRLRASSRQLSTVVGGFLFFLITALMLDEIFSWWNKFPREILGAIGLLIILERTVRLIRARSRGGTVLIDLGRMPIQDMMINLFAGIGLVWIAVMDIAGIVRSPHWAFRDISLQVLGLAVAYAVLIQAFGRRRLVDHGVFFGTGFCRWEAIRSYGWEKETATSTMLVLHKHTNVPVLHFTTLSVKSELVGSIEEIFSQHSIDREREAPKPAA